MLKVGLEINLVSLSCKITEEFKDFFNGIGKLKDFKLKIIIRKYAQPYAQLFERVPFGLRKPVEELLDMLTMGVTSTHCSKKGWGLENLCRYVVGDSSKSAENVSNSNH